MIRLSKKYSGLQFFAPEDHYINVNGSSVQIYLSTSYNATWLDNANYLTNPSLYKIVDDKVMWYNSVILQYKGVDVSPTDFIHDYEDYTTRATDETWVLKSSGMTAPDNAIDTAINFKNAAGDAFTRINIYAEGKGLHISYYNGTEETFACSGGDGVTGSNATITFLTSPTGDLLEWLQANGTKQQETLTPVLSAGTYKWADILGNMPASTDFFDIKINFTSNNNNYSALGVYSDGIKLPVVKLRYVASDDSTTAYNEGDWVVDSYQTLIIVEDQQVSQAFYNWAITGGNLVKQTTSSAPKLMSFGGKYFKTSSGKYLAPPQN